MKKIIALLLLAVCLGWLLFSPVAIDPVAWEPEKAPGLEGRYAVNDRLAGARRFGEGVGIGPESVLVDDHGRVYTGFEDGRIMRFDPEGGEPTLIANTGGRPLGLAFAANDDLIVADGYQGLMRITRSGAIQVLATEAEGTPFGFTNNVAVARDGRIYFSDASSKFGPAMKARDDIIEHGGHGRLLRHDPRTGSTEVLMDGLQFANGVAVTPDQHAVLVAQTGSYNILRYWLKGERRGEQDVFIDNLPGLPDNIRSNGRNTIWVALYAPRNALLDTMAPYPFLRKIAFRMPQALQPQPAPHAFVLGLSARDATVTHNLQHLGDESYHPITGVHEYRGKLYLGSLLRPSLAVVDLDAKEQSD